MNVYIRSARFYWHNFLFKIPFEQRHVTLPFLTTGRCEPISASTHPQWLSVCLNSFAEEFVSFRKIFRIKSTMLNQIHAWLWWNLGLGRAYDTYDTCKSSFYKKWDHCKCSLNMKYFFQLVSYNSVNSMKTKSRNNIFLKSRFMQNQKFTDKLSLMSQIFKCEHCLKSVQIRSFSWSVFSRTRAEYGDLRFAKIRTGKNSVFEHFFSSGDLAIY